MALIKERKGEIALQVLKHLARQKGLRLNANTKREIVNEAKQCGIPTEEALELAEEIVREMVDETFRK